MFSLILAINVLVGTTAGYLLGYFLGITGVILAFPTGLIIGMLGFLIAERLDDAY
jgi:hypothetical protein